MNPFFVSIFETLGAVPVPAPSSEIYTGIQLGTFNGEDNSIQIQYDFKTFEVAKNFSIVNYIADLSFIFVNRDFYYSLSTADRELFHRAAQEFVRVDMERNESYLQTAMDGGQRLGVEFYTMSEANKQGFINRLSSFFTEFQRNYTAQELSAFQDAVRRTAP
jgi:TRAP-type C4-dicarboxylate transport system substrate-binding protein